MSDENGNDSDDDLMSHFVVVPFSREGEPDLDLDYDNVNEGSDVEQTNSEQGASRMMFDKDLPATHSYMGEMDRVSGRTIIPDYAIITLPLLPGCPGAWLPGQTFPLMATDHVRCELLRKVVRGDHLFGCRARGYRPNQTNPNQLYGTTCEIYEFSDSHGLVSIKAKVRQRFKKVGVRKVDGSVLYLDCQILPEVKLRAPLSNYFLPSLDRIRYRASFKCQIRESTCSPWPHWVYKQYDSNYLRSKASNKLNFLKQGLGNTTENRAPMPKDPTDLSFWLGAHLGADERLFLIRENCPIRRLRWMLSLMMECQRYHCDTCDSLIGHQKDFFAMSAEGAQSSYVNPAGYVHDTLTLSKANNLVLTSSPSYEHSWFPGYSWQIAVCWHCQKHVGWKFTSKKLLPKTFWGLTRHSLSTRVSWTMDSSEDENMSPVM